MDTHIYLYVIATQGHGGTPSAFSKGNCTCSHFCGKSQALSVPQVSWNIFTKKE